MTKYSENKKKSFLTELLTVLDGLSAATPYNLKKKMWRSIMGYPPQRISHGLYYLQKKDLIKRKKTANGFAYELTISGRQRLLLANIPKNKWSPKDGNSCIVIFDIPESKRQHRRFIRRFLLKNGFINLQKSVLIGPKFLPKEFLELLKEWDLTSNVTLIKGQVLHL